MQKMVYESGLRLSRKVEVWWSKSREEPWRAQAASTRQSRSNPNFRGNRVDTIFRAGLAALLFFSFGAGLAALLFFRGDFENQQPL
jgi:hypothetical protein